jgi:dTDP-4-dehydrorhamnose 3,5-epimerase
VDGWMIFTETVLAGAFVVDLERHQDDRGFFARSFCQREFAAHGLPPAMVQGNVAFNRHRGTLRGLHFQFPPAAETKFVRCTRGRLFDVIVDLRPESPTYLRHVGVELSADNGVGLFVPERFAHGYQVLDDDTEATYLVGQFYTPGAESGLPFDDPRLAIDWPLAPTLMSDKDRRWRPLADVESLIRPRLTVPLQTTAP